jgi:hypothetical protein
MSGATDSLEDDIRTHLLRSGTWSKPSAWWWGLFTTLPGDDGLGGVEVTAGGYGRISRGPLDANWDATAQNISALKWGRPTADWGGLVGVGAWTLQTGGVLKMFEALDNAPFVVRAGDEPPEFAPTKLKILFL